MATHDEVLTPPDRRVFWRWVGQAARPYVGWILVALGALAILIGWYGASGQSLTAKQLPYLISGGLSGLGLIVIGAVFLATDNVRRQIGRLEGVERKVDDLYSLLVVEPAPTSTPTPASVGTDVVGTDNESQRLLALPTGSTFHRPNCALIHGKAEAVEVSAADIAARSLEPCPVCEPPTPHPDSSPGKSD
jgi:hypothetical protein